MPEKKGDYFADKKEAVAFYKANEKNLEDKPDWLIECIIDFAIQYPNYKEYCEVEARIKNGQELTQKQKKKYGNLKWDRDSQDYKKDEILPDTVEVKAKGEYDDIANDPEAREKYNKYGLEWGKSLPPSDKLKFVMETDEGTVEAIADTETVQKNGLRKEDWEFKKVEKSLKK